MKKFIILTLLFFSITMSIGQNLNWEDISSQYSSMPNSVKLYKASRTNPVLQIYYMDVDLNDESVAVRSYIRSTNGTVPTLCNYFGCIAAINGGFFGGNVSYSAVVYPDEVKARNVSAVTRDGKSYPVIRSFFWLDADLEPAIDWIYHFGSTSSGIYGFNAPFPYSYNDPTPKNLPSAEDGSQLGEILTGIGGGPALIKDSVITVSYDEEIFWGSGVGLTNNDPRTGIGYTKDRHIILVVADGRQTISEGVSLNELAEILLSLGCVSAMNLDGGGSTQMAIGSDYVNSPSEYRAVPSILAIVDRDSLAKTGEDGYSLIMDTENENVVTIGSDWFATANDGYWGTSPALLNQIGNGDSQIIYNITLTSEYICDVYAWWVASTNRCTDTPYIINHAAGSDTIRVNQTTNHATWNKLGTYTFNSSRGQSIAITDNGTAGTYVVADGIKLISNTPFPNAIRDQITEDIQTSFTLLDNFPNPFNPTTNIRFSIPEQALVKLTIYTISGKTVEILLNNARLNAGEYTVPFDGKSHPSGIYFCCISTENCSQITKMLLVK